MHYKNIQEYIQSKSFQKIIGVVGVVIVALVIFQAGMFVGYRKASFAYRFGDNYYRAFGGHGLKLPHGSRRGGFIDANGTVGKIVSINLPTFVVAGFDDVEKVILIGDNTHIRRYDATIPSSDLKVDDSVVVFGRPNESSQIEARLIRIVSAPKDTMMHNIKTP